MGKKKIAQLVEYILDNILNNKSVHIFVIIVIALFLRLYSFKQGEVLTTSDQAYLIQYSMKPVEGLLSGNILEFITQLFRFFNFSWGWGTLIGSAINIFILTILNIPITEFTVNFPYIIMGVLSVVVFYFLCDVLTENRLIAFICSLTLSILPFHVAMSRDIAGFAISNSLFFFLTLFFFLRHFKSQKKEKITLDFNKNIFWGMIFLGVYFGTDNQSPAILPIIFTGGLLLSSEKTFIMCMKKTIFSFLNKYLLLFFAVISPTIFGAIYLVSKGLTKSSYILNLFHSKDMSLKSNLFYFLDAIYNNVGPALLFLFIVAFFWNMYSIIKRNEYRKERIFVCLWFIFTATPWLSLLSPEQVWFNIYIIQPMISLLIFSNFFIFDMYSIFSKFNTRLITALTSVAVISIIIITIFSTANLVYGTNYFGMNFLPLYGVVEQNTGIKSAGYYVREELSPLDVVFSDAELFVSQYYFSMSSTSPKILGDLDLSDNQILNLYISLSKKENINYVFLMKQHYALFNNSLTDNNFTKKVIFVEDGVERSAFFSKNSKSTRIINIFETDNLFDEKYGSLEKLYINYG